MLLRKPFADFLSKHMKAVFDNEWWNNCVVPNIKEPFKKKMDDLDFYDLLRILINQWKELYTSITGKCNDNANDDNFKLLFDVLKLRNMISHANENRLFINDVYRQLSILLDFSNFINAYEYIIVNLKNDLNKFTKEKDTNDERKREKLLELIILELIISEVLFPSMTRNDLPVDYKDSNLRTMIILQNMKTADEIYDFYSGSLQSTKGQRSYNIGKEHNLTTF